AEILRNIRQGDLSPNAFWDRTGTIFNKTCDTLINLQDSNGNINYLACREYFRTLFFVIGIEKDICNAVIRSGASSQEELLEAANHAWMTKDKERKLEAAAVGVAAVQLDDTGQDEEANVNAINFRGRGQRGQRGRFGRGSRPSPGQTRGSHVTAPSNPSFPNPTSKPGCGWCGRKSHQEHECRTKQYMQQTALAEAQQQSRGRRGGRRANPTPQRGQQHQQYGYGYQQ
ncbi:Hypothetical predicted protein, partial [Paramuricea clavata]